MTRQHFDRRSFLQTSAAIGAAATISAPNILRARNLNEKLNIAIIGAGFSGIGAAIQLLKAGIHSFTIFERASEIGGTWRENTYPGCACDVPSHVYSISFEQNPNWIGSTQSGSEGSLRASRSSFEQAAS